MQQNLRRMATHDLVKIFDSSKIRVVWDDEQEKYFFSVVDVVGVLTEQQTARNATIYWAVVKKRLKEEGADELITNCKQLKLVAADGKRRETDVLSLDDRLAIVDYRKSHVRESVCAIFSAKTLAHIKKKQ